MELKREGGAAWTILRSKQNKYLIQLPDSERAVRHEVFSIEMKWGSAKLIIYAYLHREYLTVMFAIDFSRDYAGLSPDEDLHKISQTLRAVQALIVERTLKYQAGDREAPKLQGDDLDIVQSIPRLIVDGFRDWTNELCKEAFSAPLASKRISLRNCGPVFLDSFGIIYGIGLEKQKERFFSLIPRTFVHDREPTIPSIVVGSDFASKSEDLMQAIWPIMRSVNKGIPRPPHIGKPEITASLLQRGGVLYVSSLGRLIPGSQINSPIIYSLVASYMSGWRLGRLIDRLHSLEVLRIVALRDLAAINIASRSISDLNRYIHDASVKGDLTKYKSAELVRSFENIEKKAGVDLANRIARSRYYVACYRDLADMVGVEREASRVEGFQPYGNFVRRRLFDSFAFIDRVGVRYADLRKRIAFIIQSNEQQSTLDLVAATRDNTATTNRLLGAAELFSIMPITYYVGTIAAHIGEDLLGKGEPQWPFYTGAFFVAVALSMLSHFAYHRHH